MKKNFVLLFVVFAVLLSGCYWNAEVEANQVGVQTERNQVTAVVGPGVYSSGSWFGSIYAINVDTLTFPVEDPEVLTKDNQAVGIKITIQARRKGDDESIRNLVRNWSSLINDANLVNTISATAREGLKNGVRGYDLNGLLNDRNGLADAIRAQLEADVDKYSAEIINVTVENISINQAYMDTLNQTAQFTAEINKEKQRQELIKQQAQTSILESEQQTLTAQAQLTAEQAKTAVEVEIARREGEKTAAQYAVSPETYELKKLELMKDILGGKTIYFIPEGTDLSLFLDKLMGSQ